MALDYAERCTAPDFWITNGAHWYLSRGDTNDWSYGRFGVPDYTLELTDPKVPPADDIAEYVGWHLDAILDFLDRPPTLTGRVVDERGHPLQATLQLTGDVTSQPFLNDPHTGAFARVTDPGATRLTVSAPGFASTEVTLDTAQHTASEELEFTLQATSLAEGVASPWAVASRRRVALPDGAQAPVELLQAGHPDVPTAVSQGQIIVEPDALAPGAWSVRDATGLLWRDALFVVHRERTTVDGWALKDAQLVVTGSGFGPGTWAWAWVGPQRRPIRLTVVAERDDEVVLEHELLQNTETGVDVALWTAGAHLALEDVRDDEVVDVTDTGAAPIEVGGGCACSTSSGHLLPTTGSMLGAALFGLWRRRP
ncbi:MAG: hypothetical protein KTR31_38330 [Myxococcales bacterium]|nr:hypothetical protein [Myxococcales bacterium]